MELSIDEKSGNSQFRKFFLYLNFSEKNMIGICSWICLFLPIINLGIVLRKLLYLTYLLKAETLSIYKLMQVIKVNKDEKLIFAAF